MAEPGGPDRERETERWFVRRGLPHFIDRYNAREDIFTRAAPFLTVVFLALLVNVRIDAEVRWWQNVRSLGVGLVLGLGGIAAVNAVRRRPLFRRPDRIGTPELVGFVVVPALVAAIVDGWDRGLETAVFAAVVLALAYAVTSYGLVPMTRWAIVQTARMIRGVTNLFVRSLPLLLLFTMFMFFNAEVWKIVDDLPFAFLWTAIGALVLVGTAFIVLRFPRELRELLRFSTWDEIAALAVGTPLGGLETQGLADPPEVSPPNRRGRFNLQLVLFFRQAVQVLLVVGAIFAFYVAFGMFTVTPSTIQQWTGAAQMDVLASFEYFGNEVVVTGELLRSSLFIAAIAGLQFTVAALVDSTYREEFFAELTDDFRQALAVRALYLTRIVGSAAPST